VVGYVRAVGRPSQRPSTILGGLVVPGCCVVLEDRSNLGTFLTFVLNSREFTDEI
jgi:hypothetical protein